MMGTSFEAWAILPAGVGLPPAQALTTHDDPLHTRVRAKWPTT